MWSAQCQGLCRKQHRTDYKGHTPNPRTEIKIPDPAVNQTRAAGLEDRDSTDHAMATDPYTLKIDSIQNCNLIGPLVSLILIFKLILICKFQNVLCALGFEVKYSKFFCRSFRTCSTYGPVQR